MKKFVLLFVMVVTMFVLSACTEEVDPCGEGTELVDGVCILIEEDNNDDDDDPAPVSNEVDCSDTTGLHSVPGSKMYTISAWLNWTFIGGHLVTDPDNAWVQDFGAAVFNVHTPSANAWEGSFTQSGMYLQEGCEYTFEFTLRTEAPSIKQDVIVFGEDTMGLSYFEQTVPLTTESKTFKFTVEPQADKYVSTGVYFANSTGMVIIEEIQITRDPIGTNQ